MIVKIHCTNEPNNSNAKYEDRIFNTTHLRMAENSDCFKGMVAFYCLSWYYFLGDIEEFHKLITDKPRVMDDSDVKDGK